MRLTSHSPRVTIINAMAHGGADVVTMMAQGNWKDGTMPLKYVRDRKAIPLNFILNMTKDLARRSSSAEDKADTGGARASRMTEMTENAEPGDD